MIQLLQPQWLWLSLGIIVPIAIHLWNVKNGKTMKIGSITYIQSFNQNKRSWKQLSEKILLLLRCLLILVLALFLSKPIINENKIASSKKGWMLISKFHATEIYNQFQKQIDSLLQKQYELRYFEPSFSRADTSDFLNIHSIENSSISYWYTLSLLNKQATGSLPIHIFSDAFVQHFTGEKFPIQQNVHWHIYTPSKQQNILPVAAYVNTNDSIVVQMVNTQSYAANYFNVTIPYKKGSFGNLRVDIEQNKVYDAVSSITVSVDTSIQKIGIYADTFLVDKVHVTAAIKAFQFVTNKKILLVDVTKKSTSKQFFQTLFWLSKQEIDSNVDAKKIIQYAKSTSIDTSVWMEQYQNLLTNINPIDEEKQLSVIPNLLSVSKSNMHHYFLHTRLHPQYNRFVWDDQFPYFILQLLATNDSLDNQLLLHNKSQIAINQLKSTSVALSGIQTSKSLSKSQLDSWVWLILLILFCMERWVSYSSKILRTE